MRTVKILLVALAFIFIGVDGFAQEVVAPGGVPKYPDGVYTKENTRTRRAIPYTHLREADVMWSKRVWRVIDLREKINHPLYYPAEPILDRKSLFSVIIDAARTQGTITCFGNPATDDEFRYEMTKSELEAILISWDTLQTEDPVTQQMVSAPVKNEKSSDQVWKYWIKEDWFFDKQRSVLDVRIIGLCPIIEKKSETGESLGADQALFWVYFPEARPVFANQEVYMRHNDAERRTLEDVFWKRMFSSYVRKESNVYDRPIIAYKLGLDALLESDRVKEDIFKYEHDLFHF
ncbi:MAG: gliding motility protein GldN [Bacteroidetes bacterium]|jgi:gliding motility associated protien GldN|nr:gliding motility protein GldN [Bacteroidota bacterium]